MDKMTLEDVCRDRSSYQRRNYPVSGKPIRVWKNGEHFIIVSDKAISKMSLDDTYDGMANEESTPIYNAPSDSKIIDAKPEKSAIFFLEMCENERKICKLNPANGSVVEIFKTDGHISWFWAMNGRLLKENFFLDHGLHQEFLMEELFLIVWGDQPTLIYKGQHFHLHEGRKDLSKAGFIVQYVRVQSEFKPSQFTDLLRYFNRKKSQNETFFADDIRDAEISPTGEYLVVLIGDNLWCYNKLGKHNIMNKVYNFTIHKEAVTILTQDLRLYTLDSQKCSESIPKRPVIGDYCLKDIFSVSREIQNSGEYIARERRKLNQLSFFSKLAEGSALFEPTYRVQMNDLRPDAVVNLTLDLKLVNSDDVIEQGFFALKISVRTKLWSFDKTVMLDTLRFQQVLSCDISLPRVEIADFPLVLAGNLVLLEESIQESSGKYLYSEKVFEEEVSPLLFLCLKKAPACQTEFTDTSERTKFLSLLDEAEDDRVRKVKKRIKMSLGKIENNSSEILSALMEHPGEGRLYSFLGQEIIMEYKDSSDDGHCTIYINGPSQSVSVLHTYLISHFA